MGIIAYVAAEFGPLVVFLALSAAVGLRAAIMGALAATLLDAGFRLWRKGRRHWNMQHGVGLRQQGRR